MSAKYTTDQIDEILRDAKHFCGSDPESIASHLIRIVVQVRDENASIRTALDASVSLQSHYAMLLNGWDGGERMQFASSDDWINRIKETTP